jgi:hypothetical protein
LTNIGREIEFFYDRRILGFDSLDQAQAFESARQTLGGAAEAVLTWKDAVKRLFASRHRAAAVAVLAALLLGILSRRLWKRRAVLPAATRAYLALRRLAARRVGPISPAVAPSDVARLFSAAAPPGRGDAFFIVDAYCASAFGGRPTEAAAERDLALRLRRLKKLA